MDRSSKGRIAVIVPAAGSGARFGQAENKIWARIGPKSVIEWTLSALSAHPRIEAIILVGAAEELDRLRTLQSRFPIISSIVAGGATRQESVQRGLEASIGYDIILVHDAARPAVSHDLVDRILEGVDEIGAAVPSLACVDSMKRVSKQNLLADTVDRRDLVAVQTPQGARRELLEQAYREQGQLSATDEAGLLQAAGIPVCAVAGDPDNIKITLPADIARAERILGVRQMQYRTGIGYDVHPFQEGRPLFLGGVQIEHDRGLAGHSDADCLLHAVCDALLGAAGMGDIGVLFPDTDVAHKDRPSLEFLAAVNDRLANEGWAVENIDVALLAEEPRIKPHRDAIVRAISGCLGIQANRVNIKATTCEGMGFVGRREGIACWATAGISR